MNWIRKICIDKKKLRFVFFFLFYERLEKVQQQKIFKMQKCSKASIIYSAIKWFLCWVFFSVVVERYRFDDESNQSFYFAFFHDWFYFFLWLHSTWLFFFSRSIKLSNFILNHKPLIAQKPNTALTFNRFVSFGSGNLNISSYLFELITNTIVLNTYNW